MPSQTAQPPTGSAKARRRRHRFRRRHTPHYYIVLAAVTAAALVVGLDVAAYAGGSIGLSEVAFGATLLTSGVVFTAYFWGFYLLMSGHIPVRRLKMLVPHAALGTVAPLLYTMNVSLSVDSVGTQPIDGLSVGSSTASCLLLALQFTLGKFVVRPERIRVLPHSHN